jgi:hypothetical protein
MRAATDSWSAVITQPLGTIIVSGIVFLLSLGFAWRYWGWETVKEEGRWAIAGLVGVGVVLVGLFVLNLIRTPYLMGEEQKQEMKARDNQITALKKQVADKERELASNPVKPELKGEIDFILLLRHPGMANITGIMITAHIRNLGTPSVITGFSLNLTFFNPTRTASAFSFEIDDEMAFKEAFGKETVYLRKKDALYNKHAERALERGGRAVGRLLFGVRGIKAEQLGQAVGTKYELRFVDVEARPYSAIHIWERQPSPYTLPNFPGLTPVLKRGAG